MQSSPGAEQRLLQGVLRVLYGAEHPVAMRQELASVREDQPLEGLLLATTSRDKQLPFGLRVHHRLDTSIAADGHPLTARDVDALDSSMQRLDACVFGARMLMIVRRCSWADLGSDPDEQRQGPSPNSGKVVLGRGVGWQAARPSSRASWQGQGDSG
jgi:hypothetical protein